MSVYHRNNTQTTKYVYEETQRICILLNKAGSGLTNHGSTNYEI